MSLRFSTLKTLFLFFSIGIAQAQVSLTLDYKLKAGELSTVPSGQYWTMQLDYAVSSTTGSASGVKIEIPVPDYINDASGFVGTVHAPASNFVWTGTAGAKKLTITFVDPVAAGSTGTLEFKLRATNGITPNGTVIHTCATMTATGATSVQKCLDETITAQTMFCAAKTFKGGGAVDNPTTYTIAIGFQSGGSGVAPNGSLNISNITLTDTYPAGAEFVSAKMYNNYGTEIPTIITNSGNSVTVTIPDYNIEFYNNWFSTSYYVEVTLKYNSSAGFSSGQSVTNNASMTFTPLGVSPITLNNGDNTNGCISDLIETHTLIAPIIQATIGKGLPWAAPTTVHPNEGLRYNIGFTNTGNVALENVEIIETVPSQLTVANSALSFENGWNSTSLSIVEYQTNLNTTWTNWPHGQYTASRPLLGAGEYITKIKFKLVSPLLPNAGTGTIGIDFVGNATTTTQNVNNCIEWNSTKAGIPTNRTACNNQITLEPTPTTAKVIFDVYNTKNGCGVPFNLNQVVTMVGRMRASVGYADVQNPTLAMFLPAGFNYIAGSEVFTPNTSGITATPILTVTPNYGGGTRTLFRWVFPNGTILPAGTTFDVTANITVGPQLVPGTDYSGDTWLMVGGDNISIYEAGHSASQTDQYDWDGDGNTTETYTITRTSYNSCSFVVSASASMESIKWVKGLCDTQYSKYPNYGQTVPGGNADYKLIVKNTGNVTMKNIQIIDILPFIGDKGVIDPQARLTAWTPNLADPISAPTGITVYYSTSGNPCRDEVKGTNPSPFPTGCETANWTTTPPTNITAVKSVKIDFGTTTLAGGDSLIFSWPMRAPVSAPTNNEIAWNSFGFVATRTDNNQALLAAEPIKVGIKVKAGAPAYYGNRVWYDTNHDGIQDASEGGVDGVKVKLFKVPTLGTTPNPATDQLINFTITGNGGYYKFSNLAVGFYYAVFCVPTNYLISPKNTGTSTNDSDGASTTYQGQVATVTAVTELVSTEDDDSWDQGIYCNFNPIITTNSPVAVGSTLTMSVSPSTGSYAWAGPNGWTATGASVSKTNMQLADAGGYAVNVYENADGSGCWASLNVDIVVGTCIPPTAGTPTITQATCNAAGTAANNDASITISGITNTTVYAYTTDGTDPAFANATAISGNAISLTNLANPLSATTYKFRLFNASASCFTDIAATLNPKLCTPTCISPAGKGYGIPPTCTGSNPNSDAQINLYGLTNVTKYGYSVGTTYTGQSYANASTITGSATTITGLSVTGINMTYIVRLFNGADGCYTDIKITMPFNDCNANCTIDAGPDQLICEPTATVDLPDANSSQEWVLGSLNPSGAIINPSTGVVTGLSINGIYSFVLREKVNTACQDEVYVFRSVLNLPFMSSCESSFQLPTISGVTWSSVSGGASVSSSGLITGMNTNGTYTFSATFGSCISNVTVEKISCPCVTPDAGADVAICLPKTSFNLPDAPSNTQWVVVAGNPAATSINASTGEITGMTVVGIYKFRLQKISDATCFDEVQVSVSNGDVPVVICSDGSTSYTLTAPATLTSVIWYNMAGTQVGTGNSLVVSANTTGLSDGSEAFYYKGINGSASGCDIELCCPVKFLTQNCCPVPNCVGVTIIKNN